MNQRHINANTESAKDYIAKRKISQLFEALITDLMVHQPDNHIEFLAHALSSYKNDNQAVKMDEFIGRRDDEKEKMDMIEEWPHVLISYEHNKQQKVENIPSEKVENNLGPHNATIPSVTEVLLNIEDYHQVAKKKLSKMAYDYYRTGVDDELTLHENIAAFKRIKLRPSVLVDVSNHEQDSNSCSVRLLNGQTICSFPVLIAPTAKHRLADDRGELSTARAAVQASTVMIVSSFATRRLEDVADEHRRALADYPTSTSQLWFQLYVYNDRQFSGRLVQRAEQAGYTAIVVTVDACRDGNREADRRNHFQLPEHMKYENFYEVDPSLQKTPNGHISTSDKFVAPTVDTSLTWSVIAWLRQITKLPIIVKGIMTHEDARLAVKAGVDGIVVSNHGGRELDTTQSTIEVLPEIVAAVREQNNITNNKLIDIYMDGGIRRGTDILKALALGAKAVLVGRPILWGLAANGCEGVVDVLEIFRREFKLAMMLCGCTSMPRTNILALPSSNYFHSKPI